MAQPLRSVGGPRISLVSTELIFALIKSHQRGGARVIIHYDLWHRALASQGNRLFVVCG